MRPWLPNWRGRVIDIDGHEWCVGRCSYSAHNNSVIIHELPFGVKIDNYIFGSKMARKKISDDGERPGLFSRDLIEHDTIVNDSSPLEIKISFKLVDSNKDPHLNCNYIMISRVFVCLLLVSATLASIKTNAKLTKCDNIDATYISIQSVDVERKGEKAVITAQVKGTSTSALLVDRIIL